MRLKVISVDLGREEAVIEAFGERRTVALLPVRGKPQTYEFYGVRYRRDYKDDVLVQLPTLLRQANPDEATTRLKVGDWTVPPIQRPEDDRPLLPSAWLNAPANIDF